MEKLVTKEVCFKLTEKEVVSRAQDAVKVTNNIHLIESKLKEHNSSQKSLLKESKVSLSKLLRSVETETELREVPCEVVHNYDKGVVQFYNCGELVEERAMSLSERQMSMQEMRNAEQEVAVVTECPPPTALFGDKDGVA